MSFRHTVYGWPNLVYGHVLVGIHMSGPAQAIALLRAIEARLRAGDPEPKLTDWWIELRNMRHRAFVEEWAGWNE